MKYPSPREPYNTSAAEMGDEKRTVPVRAALALFQVMRGLTEVVALKGDSQSIASEPARKDESTHGDPAEIMEE